MGLVTDRSQPTSGVRTALLALGAAAAVAWLAASAAPRHAAGLHAAAIQAILSLLAVVGAVVGVAALRLRGASRHLAGPLTPRIAVAGAWLAPLAFSVAARSFWALPAAIVFAVLAVGALRHSEPETAPEPEPPPLLFSMPGPRPDEAARSRASKLAASALYAAIAFAIAGATVAAAVLAALAVATVAWFLPAPGRRGSGVFARIALALLLATVIRTPFADSFFGSPWRQGSGSGPSSEREEPTGGGTSAPGGQFSGVVLLTALESEAPALRAPPQVRTAPVPRTLASPITIRFSGEYWYFYWPMRRPGSDALRKLGDPKLLTYRSVDQFTLVMQARQPLAKPMQMACCSAIELMLDIREEQPESVSVELVLLDASAKPKVRQSLGAHDLPPASPIPSTLRYLFPRPAKAQTFDEILVWFHLYEPREGHSARVAIDRFHLIP